MEETISRLTTENEELMATVAELNTTVRELKIKLQKRSFSLERFKDDDDAISFYTGFTDYAMLKTVYEVKFAEDAKRMRQWRA